tara:strand:+ start:229 stop:531 length:303 start_codon:yes stop_codon:yes gene_type:complete
MDFEIYNVSENINNIITIEGYEIFTKRKFKVLINIVDSSTDNVNEEYILVKFENQLYCIETILDIPTNAIEKKRKKFNYRDYDIPVCVYEAMVGSIVSDI